MRAVAATALLTASLAVAKPQTRPPRSYEAYAEALAQALTRGTHAREVNHYTPPPGVGLQHTVRVFALPDGKSYWYVSDGFGLRRQPDSDAGSPQAFVELATYSDRNDLRIAEILSLFGEAMLTHPANGAFNAWSYDTLTLPEDVYGLRCFVLRPGAEVRLRPHEPPISLFTVIPLTAEERPQVANVGREKARAWVEERAAKDPAAMLARWKLTH